MLLVAVAALFGAGCEKLKSRDQLNRGVQAFKSAKYGEAVEHFKQSVALDPTNVNGRLYLGTAYFQQYIPGAESPENLQYAKAARQEFEEVLKQSPNDKLALASLASLSYNQAQAIPDLDKKFAQLDEAVEWYKKLIAADPKNKEAYYTLGVIDHAKAYAARMPARLKLGMKPEDPGPIRDPKVRAALKAKNGPVIEDGINNLQAALNIDPQYDDAMAYLNLIYRERADLADNPQDYKKDTDEADKLVQKALETKQKKAARTPAAGGITPEK